MKEIHNILIKIDYDIKKVQSKSNGKFYYIWVCRKTKNIIIE